jgi:hypothetical protein
MIRAELYAIVVTDTKLFNRTGAVGVWAEKVNVAFVAHAIAEAPIGTDTGRVNKSRANSGWPVGSLKANIAGGVTRVGPRQLETTIASYAPYSLYVIKGTGTIYSKSARIPAGEPGAGQFAPLGEGSGMYIPGNPGWGGSKIRQHVSGQKANNFLGRAFDKTARTHSSLRGHSIVGRPASSV